MSVIKYDALDTAGTVTRDQLRLKYVNEELFNMSSEQREVRLSFQQASNSKVIQHVKNRRNKLMQSIRRKSLQLAETRLEQQATEIVKQKDSANMLKAVHIMKRRKSIRHVVADSSGKVVVSNEEVGALIRERFATLFQCPNSDAQSLQSFEGDPHPLQVPITSWEVNRALKRLKNRRAAGSDDLSSELIKYSAKEVSPIISSLPNAMFELDEPINFGHSLLIPLQKPGKPKDPPTSLRPTV